MLRRLLATTALLALAAAPAQAQMPLLDLRIGAHAALPQGAGSDNLDTGIGAYFRAGVPLGIAKVMGSVTYTKFSSSLPGGGDYSELTLQAGPHFSPIPLLDIGAEFGYLTDAEKFAFTPNISVGFLMLEATASYNKPFESGSGSWVTLGLGFRF